MKNLLLTLVFLCIFFSASSQDFRNSNWGDSEQQVRAAEGDVEWLPKNESAIGTMIAYPGTVGGMDALVAFVFTDNKLYSGRYAFMDEHSSDNTYLEDFFEVESILKEKYGDQDPDMTWRNKLYQEDYDEYGFAISIGHLAIYNKWEEGPTQIEHVIKGDNYEIDHMLYYTSIVLAAEAEKKRNQKKLDEF